MQEITKNEMGFVMQVFKNPEVAFNANSVSKRLELSAMGALKIGKRLEKEGILTSKKMGKAVFYKVNLKSEYAEQYVRLLLKREAEQAHSYVKRWVAEVRKIRNADLAILFGSVLKKHDQAKDVDLLLVTNQNKFSALKKEVEEINQLNVKGLHPVFQTKEDLKRNIKKRDAVVLNAIKGIVVMGEDVLTEVMKDDAREE